mmetsp:Transcript_18456/g.58267  ORF Transcript_18456/g.58267 Transcript_18456/m.58267 type:complete len:278 (-) Transcript_18456:682-1515(-)
MAPGLTGSARVAVSLCRQLRKAPSPGVGEPACGVAGGEESGRCCTLTRPSPAVPRGNRPGPLAWCCGLGPGCDCRLNVLVQLSRALLDLRWRQAVASGVDGAREVVASPTFTPSDHLSVHTRLVLVPRLLSRRKPHVSPKARLICHRVLVRMAMLVVRAVVIAAGPRRAMHVLLVLTVVVVAHIGRVAREERVIAVVVHTIVLIQVGTTQLLVREAVELDRGGHEPREGARAAEGLREREEARVLVRPALAAALLLLEALDRCGVVENGGELVREHS